MFKRNYLCTNGDSDVETEPVSLLYMCILRQKSAANQLFALPNTVVNKVSFHHFVD